MTPPDAATQQTFVEKCGKFSELYRAGRIAEMVAFFYAKDAVLEGPGLAPHVGRGAIEVIFEEVRHACGSIDIQLDPVVITAELAYGCQTNINMRDDGELEIHRGLMIWRRIDDDWFVVHDFFFTKADMNGSPLSGDFVMSLPI